MVCVLTRVWWTYEEPRWTYEERHMPLALSWTMVFAAGLPFFVVFNEKCCKRCKANDDVGEDNNTEQDLVKNPIHDDEDFDAE